MSYNKIKISFPLISIWIILYISTATPVLHISPEKVESIKPGDILPLDISVTNATGIEAGSLDISYEIFNTRNEIVPPTVQREVIPIIKDGSILRGKYSIPIDKTLAPGIYKIYITVFAGDMKIGPKIISINVDKLENAIKKTETISRNLFFKEKRIVIYNQGNSAVKYIVSEEIPWYLNVFTKTTPKPAFTNKTGTGFRHTWVLHLEPFTTTVVVYRISYIPILAMLISILLAVILVLQKAELMSIKKELKKLEIEESYIKISLVILIKNLSDRILNNVEVLDDIPTFASLRGNFETLKPEIIENDDKTTLKWVIKEIKPGDEIIISYTIISNYKMYGEIELPPAVLHYSDEKTDFKTTSDRVKIKLEEDI